MAGLAPATTQYLASLVNEFILPDPTTNDQLALGFNIPHPDSPRLRTLLDDQNQQPLDNIDPNRSTFHGDDKPRPPSPRPNVM
jgi:hypothetical protein